MPPTPWAPHSYPPTRRSDHVDVYQSASRGEVPVPDPYQWLEENSNEVDEWTTAQTAFTQGYLDKNADRQKLEEKFRASKDYVKFSAPTLLDSGHWYWFYNSGVQSQAVLYRSKKPVLPDFQRGTRKVGEVYFDPNVLSADGTAIMGTCRFSPSGEYFAYAVSHLGVDYFTIYVRPTSSSLSQAPEAEGGDGRLSDGVKWCKFTTITWTKDSKGFLYQRYPARESLVAKDRDKDAMVCYHRVGTTQLEDIIVQQDKENPDWTYGTDASEDGKYIYLVVYKDASKQNLLWVAEFDKDGVKPEIPWRKVINEFGADYHVITNHGSLIYVKTNVNAPQYKVVTIDLSTGEPEIRDFIPEQKDAKLTQVKCVNKGYFVAIYKRNVKDEIYLYSKAGDQLSRLASDFIGVASITNREKQPHSFLTFSGFNTPGTISRYDFTAPDTQRLSILRTTKLNGLNADDFESTQVWYKSKDGTKVPMFIVRHKSTKFDGTAPAIQNGYGGFAITADPFFSPIMLTFMQTYGAILAVPNIRGGGEFGGEWHKAGRRETKGNTFDDFIAAAQFLVKNKYAAPGKVAITGASNGGFLVCGSVVRAPEGTFGAAVSEGGVADLLKFNKFTGGMAWTSEYGNPFIKEDFDFVQALSPVHNVPKDRVLPATLLMTNAGDDRVVPMHSLKFVANLQYNVPQNPHPLLIRVDKSWLGHGFGKTTDKHTKDAADKWSFVAQSLGLEWKTVD
uniref:Dual function macrocyclase-peptidase POPB n=1 Tax=Amanita bisporigera TaxID=87325 RepID=POPB_AMABI|nr:RecName: Full=Dual function macrocyclase-peptidase POPB; AltName: Full=Prolyl oligopeptidase B; Short=POP B; AltName: Full=Toxin-processing prolyl oligopeptidase [Amanita bisporigera]ADN19205.1 prolyl oligopeptidase [Amanita bisporigera]